MKRLLLLIALSGTGCGSTAGVLFPFAAAAAGPSDAPGGPLHFTTATSGYDVVLTQAVVHVGGIYLNETTFGGGPEVAQGCYSGTVYTAQVTTSLDVDILSPSPQLFGAAGNAINSPALSGEVWLNGGAIDAADDPTPIFTVAGTATKNGVSYPFSGVETIGSNRIIPGDNARPGLHPICQQRIVRPICFGPPVSPTNDPNYNPCKVPISTTPGHSLLIRVDPRSMFKTVDFAKLPNVGGTYQFPDSPTNSADLDLFDGLHSQAGVYTFSWN